MIEIEVGSVGLTSESLCSQSWGLLRWGGHPEEAVAMVTGCCKEPVVELLLFLRGSGVTPLSPPSLKHPWWKTKLSKDHKQGHSQIPLWGTKQWGCRAPQHWAAETICIRKPMQKLNFFKQIKFKIINKIEILELKCIIMEMKHSLDWLKNRFEMAEERISKLESR